MNIKTLRLGLQKWLGRMKWVEQRKCLRRLKWRHWVLIALLLLITLTKTIPTWGIIYTFFVYPLIGMALSHLSGWIPFAVGDLFIALSIAWVILYPIYKKGHLGRVAEYLLWVYAWFYLAWGLNYSQPNIFYRLRMMPAQVSKQTFKDFADRYVDSLNYLSEESRVASELFACLREQKSSDSLGVLSVSQDLKDRTSKMVLQGYLNLTKKPGVMGISTPFNEHPHAKTMMFTPLSSMAGVTGSMGPFFCEFTLNGDVLPQDYPATYAHEFAHFLGVTNEGEANFYSYLVCTSSPDKAVRFSGYYHLLFHVIANVDRILGEEEGNALIKRINPKVLAMAIKERKYWQAKRCKALDTAQDFIFDLYLKGNNVKEGRKSYSGVMMLILSWEEKKNKEQRIQQLQWRKPNY